MRSPTTSSSTTSNAWPGPVSCSAAWRSPRSRGSSVTGDDMAYVLSRGLRSTAVSPSRRRGAHMSDHPSPSGKLIVGHDGPVTTITLNRPEVHNALDQELSAELNVAVKDVAVDRECRVLVIRGAGHTFC